MANTKEAICSRAFILFGANPIASFDSGSTEAIVASNLYESVVEDALTSYRWRFATDQQTLNRLTDVPVARWDAAYQSPANALEIHAILVNDYNIDFDRYEGYIYCNANAADTVDCDFTFRAKEADWSAAFVQALTFELAAHFAGALTQKSDLVEKYFAISERKYAIARRVEGQSRTTRRVRSRDLINVRRGGISRG